jgi:hypothetical protein
MIECQPVIDLLGEQFIKAFYEIKLNELAAYDEVISSGTRSPLAQSLICPQSPAARLQELNEDGPFPPHVPAPGRPCRHRPVVYRGAGPFARPARALNLYTWDTYIGKNTVADFTKAAGAGVNISLFANNDELFAKLRSGNQGYDVIVPSNDFVERMHAAGLLTELDHSKIPISRTSRRSSSTRRSIPAAASRCPIPGSSPASAIASPRCRACPTAGNGCSILIATRAHRPAGRSERAVRDRREVPGPPGQHQRSSGDRASQAMLLKQSPISPLSMMTTARTCCWPETSTW